MKLVKQTRLVFVEGKSDKIYEVDLCEVGAGKFVVNFRYGKRGAALKDGSKTVAPVDRAAADQIFAKLVKSKLDSGYVEEGAAPPRAAAPPPPRAAATTPTADRGDDPRAQRILERLAATGTARRWFRARDDGPTWPLERAIWRAGELRLRAAEPLLIALIGTATSTELAGGGKGLRDYCVAWALGRCGGTDAVRALTALYGNTRAPDHVRRIAAESLRLLGDEASTREFAAYVAGQLPVALRAVAAGDDPAAFARALDEIPLQQHSELLYQLYQIDSPTVRPALLAALAKAPPVRSLRYIWKAAELRADARVFGLLVRGAETARPGRHGPGYTAATRAYLRRRAWRLLRRKAQLGDQDYVRLAAGILLAMTDEDAGETRIGTDGRGRRVNYPTFARLLAFNHILYGASARYHLPKNGKAWRLRPPHRPDDAAPTTREEAFPTLWDREPAALMMLCAESQCAPVHTFAAKALLAAKEFLAQLEADDAILLLGRPYDPTAQVGFVIARACHRPGQPNLALLAALAATVHGPARTQAFAWIDAERRAALGDSAFLAGLIVARHDDTRAFARRLLRSAVVPPEIGAPLVARVIAALLALGDGDDGVARDAVATVLATLPAHLTTVGAPVLVDLLNHPLAGVQELGAELLVRHDVRAGQLPADVVLAVLHSPHDSVRAVGLRLLGELGDDALTTLVPLLVRLACDAHADVRNATRPLIARAAARSTAALDELTAGLIEALLRRRLPDDVPTHVLGLLTGELVAGNRALERDTILRLLGSGSPHAQEFGGRLLAANLGPADLALPELVALGSHEILAVRQAAWSMYERDLGRVQRELAAAVRILDAKWQDTRQWGFDFFRRDDFTRAHFTADVMIGVIDSVRDDVQAFGRELLSRHFDDTDGPALLAKLAEHPTRAVQLFATNYLERFATGRPELLPALVPYFTSVLSRVNQGRIAKQRVLTFLTREGSRDVTAAALAMPLLFRISATISIEYRAAALEAMLAIHRACPTVELPVRVKPWPTVAAGAR